MCSVCKDWLKGESMGCVQSFALTRVFFPGQVGSISKIEKGIWRTKTIQIVIQDFRIDVGSGLGYRWFDYILCSTMTDFSLLQIHLLHNHLAYFCETHPSPFLLSAHIDLHLWTFQGCGLLTSIPPWWRWRATAKRPRQEGPGWILICRTWWEVVSPHCQPPHLPHHQTALCVWQVSDNIASPNPQFFTVSCGMSSAYNERLCWLEQCIPQIHPASPCWCKGNNLQLTSFVKSPNNAQSSGAVWTGRWDWVLIPYPILPLSLISCAISVDVNRLTTLVRGCRLLTHSMPAVDSASCCSSTGEIQSVDEKSAFSWEECDGCGSDQLAMKSSTGSVVWCECV